MHAETVDVFGSPPLKQFRQIFNLKKLKRLVEKGWPLFN